VAGISKLRRILRLGRREDGIAALEFALVIPILLLLVVGGMDFGHMLYIDHLITNASREGARYAAKYTDPPVDPTSSAISTYVKTTLNYNSFNLDSLVVSGSYAGTTPNRVATVTVTADKHWWILGSLPGFTNPTTLTAKTAMAVERP
jgi:Flp pilus assembly protein TadG